MYAHIYVCHIHIGVSLGQGHIIEVCTSLQQMSIGKLTSKKQARIT